MAKSMEEGGGYRAVVIIRTAQSEYRADYYGPWNRASVAKAEVTKARKHYRSFVDGWIEQATWVRVD